MSISWQLHLRQCHYLPAPHSGHERARMTRRPPVAECCAETTCLRASTSSPPTASPSGLHPPGQMHNSALHCINVSTSNQKREHQNKLSPRESCACDSVEYNSRNMKRGLRTDCRWDRRISPSSGDCVSNRFSVFDPFVLWSCRNPFFVLVLIFLRWPSFLALVSELAVAIQMNSSARLCASFCCVLWHLNNWLLRCVWVCGVVALEKRRERGEETGAVSCRDGSGGNALPSLAEKCVPQRDHRVRNRSHHATDRCVRTGAARGEK